MDVHPVSQPTMLSQSTAGTLASVSLFFLHPPLNHWGNRHDGKISTAK